MTDKFLGTGNIGTNISNGTISIYGSKIGARNLNPSRAIKTDSQGRLQTTDLDIADVNNLQSMLDNVLSNPYTPPTGQLVIYGEVKCNDVETNNYFSVNDELQKIDNFTASTPDNTNIIGTIHAQDVACDRVYNVGKSIYIELDNESVNISASEVLLNGNEVISTPYLGTLESSALATGYIYDESKSIRMSIDTSTFDVNAPFFTFNGNKVVSTPFPSILEAQKFVTTGGTNLEYIMGDGTLLKYSSNSGNSNYYLYKNQISVSNVPQVGFVSYNNITQSNATFIYINYLTRDGIDIQVFFKQISQLTDIYLQDQLNSANFIQYNVTATPIITLNSRISIAVIMSSYGGTGFESFGNNTNILVSFFTNAIEADTRISSLETKTQNQTATPSLTTFTGQMNAGSFVKTGGLVTEFLKANGTVDSNKYSRRKFSLISTISGSGILTNFNMMTGAYAPPSGVNSLANEAIVGDTYKLTVYGSSFNAVSMSFTIGLLNSTHTVSGPITSAVTAPYVIEIMYTVRSINSLCVNFFLNSYFTTISQGQFGYSSSTVIPCNINISSVFTMTYTCTGSGTFTVHQMTLFKL